MLEFKNCEIVKNVEKCPNIFVKIQGIETDGLINTGSEITCISKNFFENNKNKFKSCKILPIVGTSNKPIKLKRQIYADLNLDNEKYSCVFLIIPKLNKNCILGIDVLKKLKGRINIKENYVILRNEDKELKIEFINEEKYWVADAEIEEKVANAGRISIYEHELKIKDDKPFIIKTYPIPMRLRELVTAELNKLLELGSIRRSNRPYINPLVTSLKKDGSVRIRLDARKLNEILISDYECAEPIEVLFQRRGGSKIMSTMDLASSFWQIPQAEESKKYKAFLHEGRCYEFCVTPFGLKTSTAALVRALDFVLNGLGNFYLTFIDVIFCASENVHQHLQHLELLFHRLMEKNLTINLEKSNFLRSEVKFLGHILTSTGIKPDPEKIETIQNVSRPRNLKELRGFLCLINFYTKFSKNHAAKIVPFLELLKKGVKWSWNDDLERVFNEIKLLISSSVLLNYSEIEKPFYLKTDTSDVALGAVLFQLDEDRNPCPIIYASWTLKGAELAYYTTEKELLAIVWALHKFRSYIMGGKIIIRTDHKALTFLKTCKLLSGRVTRWTMAIQDYDISIEYCPGKNNLVADTLSRLPGKENAAKMGDSDGKIILCALAKKPSSGLRNRLQNFAQEQKLDPILGQKIKDVEERRPLNMKSMMIFYIS